MKWYIPSWNGDLRLVPDDTDKEKTLLHIEKPTEREKETLARMGNVFIEQGWLEELTLSKKLFRGIKPVVINAPLEKVGPVVSALMRPGPAVLTGILLKDGEMITHSGSAVELSQTIERVQAEVITQPEKKPKAAVTVKRHTPCCPQCIPGSIEPAREVLLTFLNEEEHESWAKDRTIVVTGGMSGHKFLLAHRHTEIARRVGRICYDLDSDCVIHFHDWTVPPEEEVLAAKLILEHREPWLNNEATHFGGGQRYKNPFGGVGDGIADAAFTQGMGEFFNIMAQGLK